MSSIVTKVSSALGICLVLAACSGGSTSDSAAAPGTSDGGSAPVGEGPTTGGAPGAGSGLESGNGGTPQGASGMAGSGGTGGSPTNSEGSACRASWLYCEDFESTQLGAIPADLSLLNQRGNGTAQVDDTQAFSGKHAVRLDVPEGGAQTQLVKDVAGLIGEFPGSTFFRIRMRLDGLPPAVRDNGAPHWAYLQMTPIIPGHEREVFGAATLWDGEHRMNLLQLGWDDGALIRDCAVHTATENKKVLSGDQWMCIEYELHASGVRMWLDDELVVERSELSGNCEWFVGQVEGMKDVRFGYRLVGENAQDYQMWADDVVVDDERIGCD